MLLTTVHRDLNLDYRKIVNIVCTETDCIVTVGNQFSHLMIIILWLLYVIGKGFSLCFCNQISTSLGIQRAMMMSYCYCSRDTLFSKQNLL